MYVYGVWQTATVKGKKMWGLNAQNCVRRFSVHSGGRSIKFFNTFAAGCGARTAHEQVREAPMHGTNADPPSKGCGGGVARGVRGMGARLKVWLLGDAGSGKFWRGVGKLPGTRVWEQQANGGMCKFISPISKPISRAGRGFSAPSTSLQAPSQSLGGALHMNPLTDQTAGLGLCAGLRGKGTTW